MCVQNGAVDEYDLTSVLISLYVVGAERSTFVEETLSRERTGRESDRRACFQHLLPPSRDENYSNDATTHGRLESSSD